MLTVEEVIREAVSGGLEKTASAPAKLIDLKAVASGLEKCASAPAGVDIQTKLIKEAAASLRSAIAEIASKDERIAGLEKVSSVRKTVDEMLADGLISTYDVQEKVAEMLSANEYTPHISGNQFQKLAGDIDAKPQGKRGMFDSVIQ